MSSKNLPYYGLRSSFLLALPKARNITAGSIKASSPAISSNAASMLVPNSSSSRARTTPSPTRNLLALFSRLRSVCFTDTLAESSTCTVSFCSVGSIIPTARCDIPTRGCLDRMGGGPFRRRSFSFTAWPSWSYALTVVAYISHDLVSSTYAGNSTGSPRSTTGLERILALPLFIGSSSNILNGQSALMKLTCIDSGYVTVILHI